MRAQVGGPSGLFGQVAQLPRMWWGLLGTGNMKLKAIWNRITGQEAEELRLEIVRLSARVMVLSTFLEYQNNQVFQLQINELSDQRVTH